MNLRLYQVTRRVYMARMEVLVVLGLSSVLLCLMRFSGIVKCFGIIDEFGCQFRVDGVGLNDIL